MLNRLVAFILFWLIPISALLSPGNPNPFAPLLNNPLVRIVSNTYSFFYWLPRRNLPYDAPWTLFRNNSAQFIQWYQIPHNLPPYRYLDEGYPDDFFCWGLPGNTLPLGNWDPWGMQQVSPKVVRKYRESELKHGRLAMLGSTGFLVQESFHPLHPEIGGLAITHMQQLAELPIDRSLFAVLGPLLPRVDSAVSLEYLLLLLALASFEAAALRRNWTRWVRAPSFFATCPI